jgi:hypothetical protein
MSSQEFQESQEFSRRSMFQPGGRVLRQGLSTERTIEKVHSSSRMLIVGKSTSENKNEKKLVPTLEQNKEFNFKTSTGRSS